MPNVNLFIVLPQRPVVTLPSTKVNSSLQQTHIPSYQLAFNLFFQLARLQLLRESIPSNWQLASCALVQLAGIWGFPPHPTHLQPLTPDAIKDCSRLLPLGSNEKKVGRWRGKCGKSLSRTIWRNKSRVDASANQPSSINVASDCHLTHYS